MANMQHIINVEAAILNNGKWLFVRRGYAEKHESGMFSLVGGKIDDISVTDNILEETLIREIQEEVGIQVKNLKYIYSTHFTMNQSESVVDIIFYCEYKYGEIRITRPDEISEYAWLSNDEIQKSAEIKDWTKKYIRMAYELTK